MEIQLRFSANVVFVIIVAEADDGNDTCSELKNREWAASLFAMRGIRRKVDLGWEDTQGRRFPTQQLECELRRCDANH